MTATERNGRDSSRRVEGPDRARASPQTAHVQQLVASLAAKATEGCAPDLQGVLAFASARNYPQAKAQRFHELNKKRGWRFPNGKPIRDWQDALHNFCHSAKRLQLTLETA